MITTAQRLDADVKAQVKEIVASGADIRPRLVKVVSEAACQSGEGLVTLIRAAIDGAREGLARAVPTDRDDVLRQVVDALADGISQTALALQLAFQESVSVSQQYAKEDLALLRDDLTTVRNMFTETVGQGLRTCKELTTSQISNAMTHTERVAKRLNPVLTRVLDAIAQHPVVLAREGFQAGVSMGQYATGSLFQALGRLLERAGGELRREHL